MTWRPKLSASPTNPHAVHRGALANGNTDERPRAFDVAELYDGPLGEALQQQSATTLDEKLRQAYFWIVNTAILSTHYDIEYHDGPSFSARFGDSKGELVFPSGQSYSSYVLLPLLTFATRRKCLLVGGPGRGKTASAILMGVLSGASPTEVKRSMQHGHPQMTIADLLGNPLPADLVSAQSMEDIRISWRSWLSSRVKIIDEYNRIPTRTQSALLTVMGDGYAEILDHTFKCPESAWYLTANDDRGGGTYQVIEALRDRVDVTVQALSFNPRFLGELLDRVEADVQPEDIVPSEIIFTDVEVDEIGAAIRRVPVPYRVRRRIEFFASQFEFSEGAGVTFEYRTKDSMRVQAADRHTIGAEDSGRDRLADLGCQTKNGLSVRNLMTLLVYAKSIAWFRGQSDVQLEDVRQVLPFVLRDKLVADPEAPFFETQGRAALRTDVVGWLRTLFDLSCAEYDRLDLDRDDPVAKLQVEFAEGLDGLSANVVRERIIEIERVVNDWSTSRKLYGHVYEDLLELKYLHQRYTNYLRWVQTT
jgi:MoxR-like ATPase